MASTIAYLRPDRAKEDNTMLLGAAKERFRNKSGETDFKLEHMWQALHHQPKWCAWHVDNDSSDGTKRSLLSLDDDYSFASPRTMLDQHDLLVALGQERNTKGRGQQRVIGSPLPWRRTCWTSYTRPAIGWLNQNLFEQFTNLLDQSTIDMDDDIKKAY